MGLGKALGTISKALPRESQQEINLAHPQSTTVPPTKKLHQRRATQA